MFAGSSACFTLHITSTVSPSSLRKRLDLPETDAVLAGARSAHRQGALDESFIHLLGGGHLGRIIGIHEQHQVEVAVTDMPDGGGEDR